MGRPRLWLLPLILLLTILGAGRQLVDQSWNGPGPLAHSADIVVPRGPTTVVGQALQRASVIGSALAFRIAAALTEGRGALHAGEFAFPAHGSLHEVLEILRHGRQVEHHLTIPEGLTARQIAALINQAPAMTGHVVPFAEGVVLPDTYDYLRGTARQALLARAERALVAALATLWPNRAPSLPLDTPEQAITLASIVERETARPDERPMVAAVYINRLRAGMRLQADPTVIYGVTDGAGVMDRPLDDADLRMPDPYNTYLTAGLPPGPIAAPGTASIEAVLHPAQTDALYFVADGSGGHVFSHGYAQQEKNVAKLRALEGPAIHRPAG